LPASVDLSNPYTKTLWNKLFALFVAGVSLAHDLYFGKRAYERKFNLYMARFLGFLNLVLSLLVVFFAIKLRLGG
jgi:hypothetical protein